MKRVMVCVAALCGVIVASLATPALAGSAKKGQSNQLNQHPKSDYYRGAPQVRGFHRSVGGYSYNYLDGILDYRDQSVFLDPNLSSRRDNNGPFDSGFFFDSNVSGSIISDAPYMN